GIDQPTDKVEMRHESVIAQLLGSSPEWAEVLWYDELAGEVRADRPPIRLDCERPGGFTSSDELAVLSWLQITRYATTSRGTVRDVVDALSRRRTRHPI